MSLADLSDPLLTDGQHPPTAVAVAGAAFGLISLMLVVFAWRGAKAAAIGLVAVRVLSALAAVPALTEGGVPGFAVVLAGVLIALTLLGVVVVLAGLRRPVGAVAR